LAALLLLASSIWNTAAASAPARCFAYLYDDDD
jgi:hypothetical protein